MTTIIAIIALVISICAIYEIEKLKKNNVKNIEKEIKETDRIKNILAGLKQCDCELIVKETMFLIDVPYSVEGKIIDLDDDWVLIVN